MSYSLYALCHIKDSNGNKCLRERRGKGGCQVHERHSKVAAKKCIKCAKKAAVLKIFQDGKLVYTKHQVLCWDHNKEGKLRASRSVPNGAAITG